MENKLIRIVWCDDIVDKYANDESYQERFKYYNCVLYQKARTSNELETILKEKKDCIDAVIVDFNVDNSNLTPENSARGFMWTHEHIKDYAPIPFYLYSARDYGFIVRKYIDFDYADSESAMKNDYFFCENNNVESKRNRYFQADDQFEDMLKMITEEVPKVCSPEYIIRQEYHEAFEAISKLGIDENNVFEKDFMRIMLPDKTKDKRELCNVFNSFRQIIEKMVSKLVDEYIVPSIYKDSLNDIPYLLSGNNKNSSTKNIKNDSQIYSHEDRMPPALFHVFRFLLDCIQDGSHHKTSLEIKFQDYIQSTADIYIIKALAIICMDIIKWMDSFYNKYKSLKPAKLEDVLEGFVKELKTVRGKEGAIVIINEKKYFVRQYPPDDTRRYKTGHKVAINKSDIDSTTKDFGDFYCKIGNNLTAK